MDFKLENVLVSLHSLKPMGLGPFGASALLFLRNGELLGHSPIQRTKTMLMGSSRKLSLLHCELQLYFDDECLRNVDTHKLLGAHLDKSLN